jgi:predicted enzyme related to lactoylglutathione lyase
MPIKAVYKHTNIVARDWKSLVQFYQQVFGCIPAPPERYHHGSWVEKVTVIPRAEIRGIHLRLPGYGERGPTLEILSYNQESERYDTAANRPGFAHIAFSVEDVEEARQCVIEAGGGSLGEIASVDVPGAGRLTVAYLTDPEGNIVEVMTWS